MLITLLANMSFTVLLPLAVMITEMFKQSSGLGLFCERWAYYVICSCFLAIAPIVAFRPVDLLYRCTIPISR